MIISVGLDDTFDSWRIKCNSIATSVGDIALLTTTDKTSDVAAINELNSLKAPIASPVFTGTASAPQLNLTGTGLNFTNATKNLINFNTYGLAAPAFTTRSDGTKVVLYSAIGASSADHAFGVETNTLWYGVPTTAMQFKWYGGITLAATLSGTGNLTTVGSVTATQFNGSGAGLTAIPNTSLVNSSVIIGSSAVALGTAVTAFVGLTSVTSTAFVGSLTGNASTASTLQTTRAINGVNFNGSAAITVPVNSVDDTTTVSVVYPLWTTAAGNTAAKISTTKISFVPSTGILTATGFAGSLSGNASTATTLQTARAINGINFNGSAAITVPVNSTDDNALASTVYPLWVSTTGNVAPKISTTKFSFNPSTGAVTATSFTGAGTGLTSLTAGNLTGTIPSAVLGNSSVYLGTTAVALNRGTGALTLNGVSIDGNAATVTTNANLSGDVYSSGNTTVITNNAVTLGKLATMATASFLGRNTAATGNVEVLSTTTARTMLSINNVENTALSSWTGTQNIATVHYLGSTAITANQATGTITSLTGVSITGNAGTSTTATHLAGGVNTSIPYQTAAGATSMSAAGATGTILSLVGGIPTWIAPSGLTAGSSATAGSILGGTAGAILWQNGVNSTAFTAAGTTGQILQSNGTASAPTWISQSAMTVGNATLAANSTLFNSLATTDFTIDRVLGYGATTTKNLNVGNLTVSNLTVNGTTTTINSTVQTIDDPVLTLGGDAAPVADDNKDRGVEFRWHNGTVAKVGFFGFDDSTGFLTFIPDATNTAEVFTGTKGQIDVTIDGSNILGGTTGQVLTSGGTWTSAVNTNTVSTIVKRDASGNFSAGTITAALSGNASTSTSISGGAAGRLPYQSAVGTTSFALVGTSGQILISGGTGSPTWLNQNAITLQSSQITTALGFTPYNATNPNNYINSAGAPVQSVAGRTGAVVLDQADIAGLTILSSPTFANVTATSFNGNATSATSATSATNATNSTNVGITNDTTTATTVYPSWVATTTGNNPQKVSSTKLSFVPSTGVLSATTFSGAHSGSGASLTGIPNAALNNSSITVGSTVFNLGGLSTTLAGLTSVTSTSFVGALTGNASTATSIAGGNQWGFLYQSAVGTTSSTSAGSSGQVLKSNGTSAPTWVNGTISGIALGSNLNTLSLGVSGTGLSGSASYNGSGATTFTVTSNATSTNTASTIVARDANGAFSAGAISAAGILTVSGNTSKIQLPSYYGGIQGSYSTFTELYSSAKTAIGNNIYTDGSDIVTGQVRYKNTHATYGHTIYEQSAGVHTWYGASASVVAGQIVTKVQQAVLDSSGLTVVGAVNGLNLISNATGFTLSGGTTAVAATFAGGAAYTISGTNGATYTLPGATSTLVATTGNVATATSIASGTQWGFLYQSASGVTASTTAGAIGQVLKSNATSAPTWVNGTISGVALGSNLNTLTLATSGNGLSGSASYNGSGGVTFTVNSNATNLNTGNTFVYRDGVGNFSAGTITASLTGNSTTSTYLLGDETNWATYRSRSTANFLGWKNFGNGHVIFDASNGTSPTGSVVSNSTPQNIWSPTLPTLMGWNGTNTYGVRVDSCRVADGAITANSAANGLTWAASTTYNIPATQATVSWTHGLGTTPIIVAAYLYCHTADTANGYSVGDYISLPGSADGDGARTASFWFTATTVNWSGYPVIKQKTTGSLVVPSSTYWYMFFRAAKIG